MAADLITLAEGALLTQFLTPTAKHYGEATLKRIQQLGDRAKAILAGASREPQGVEEKILFPLVQAASLESDPLLADLWAALLANAADPAQNQVIKPAYIEILKQLNSQEAQLLANLFVKADVSKRAMNVKPEGMTPWVRKDGTLDTELDLLQEQTRFTKKSNVVQYSEAERVEIQNFDALIDNLLRQQVIIPASSLKPFVGRSSGPDNYRPKTSKVFFSSLGYDFMLAVSLPEL